MPVGALRGTASVSGDETRPCTPSGLVAAKRGATRLASATGRARSCRCWNPAPPRAGAPGI